MNAFVERAGGDLGDLATSRLRPKNGLCTGCT